MKKIIFIWLATIVLLTTTGQKIFAQCSNLTDLFQQVGPAINRVIIGYNFASIVLENGGAVEKNGWNYGFGTGVFVTTDGYLLTNYHVISSVQDYKYEKNVNIRVIKKEIKILWRDAEFGPDLVFDAEVAGYDAELDIAVLKIDGKGKQFPVAKLGNSDKINTGENIFAIGSPFELDNALTYGIISNTKRNIGGETITHYIQHQAPINPGNSGGPLYNCAGEIIGINTLFAGQGIAFAIPINRVKEVIPDLINTGKSKKYHWGLEVLHLNLSQIYFNEQLIQIQKGIEQYKIPIPSLKEGFLLLEPSGPAEKAGLKAGDVIININGDKLYTTLELKEIIHKNKLSPVNLEYIRSGEKISATIYPEEK